MLGRVRVQLYDEEHRPLQSGLRNVRALVQRIAQELPKTATAVAKPKGTEKTAAAAARIDSVNVGVTLVPRTKKKSKRK